MATKVSGDVKKTKRVTNTTTHFIGMINGGILKSNIVIVFKDDEQSISEKYKYYSTFYQGNDTLNCMYFLTEHPEDNFNAFVEKCNERDIPNTGNIFKMGIANCKTELKNITSSIPKKYPEVIKKVVAKPESDKPKVEKKPVIKKKEIVEDEKSDSDDEKSESDEEATITSDDEKKTAEKKPVKKTAASSEKKTRKAPVKKSENKTSKVKQEKSHNDSDDEVDINDEDNKDDKE
jgi:hypothetical protein